MDETLTVPQTVSFRRLIEVMEERDYGSDKERAWYAVSLQFALDRNAAAADAVALTLSSIVRYRRKRRKVIRKLLQRAVTP